MAKTLDKRINMPHYCNMYANIVTKTMGNMKYAIIALALGCVTVLAQQTHAQSFTPGDVITDLGSSVLGCEGVSSDSYFTDLFQNNNIVNNFGNNYLNSILGKFLFTSALQSPTQVAMFDSLQTMGTQKQNLFQQGCRAAAPERSEYVKILQNRCSSLARNALGALNIGGQMFNITGNPESFCYDRLENDSTGLLAALGDQFGEVVSRAGQNLPEMLRGSICGRNYAPWEPSNSGCGVMAMLDEFTACNPMFGLTADTCGQGTTGAPTSEAIFSAGRILQSIYYGASTINQAQFSTIDNMRDVLGDDKLMYAYSLMRENLGDGADYKRLDRGLPIIQDTLTQPLIIASNNMPMAPNKPERIMLASAKPLYSNVSLFKYDLDQVFLGDSASARTANSDLVDEFKQYIHCSNADENPFMDLSNLAETVKSEQVALGLSATTITDADVQNMAADIQNIRTSELFSDVDVLGSTFATRLTGVDGKEILAFDAPDAVKLMEVATNCVYNNYIQVDLLQLLKMSQLPSSDKELFTTTVANETSYLGVELMLRFLKHKVYDAKIHIATSGMGAYPSNAENEQCRINNNPMPCLDKTQEATWEAPEFLLVAVDAMADSIENKIQAIRAIKEGRKNYQEVIRYINDKLNERAQQNIGR